MNVIETNNLTKVYSSSFGSKKVEALNGLSLSISEGMIFGLLGPNGAGKTTLIKILLGITFPTSGSAKILEVDVSDYKIKSKVGYLPESHKYPTYLSGRDVLYFYGRLSGIEANILDKKIDELLALVDLTKWKKTKVKSYSKGMMQRLGLAQALINDPQLIFLDEPTDGVDPIGRKEIRDVLKGLKDQGKTIFLNSHLLSEVELITDRVGILNKGKLLKEGTVQELTTKGEEYIINTDRDISEDLPAEIKSEIVISKLKSGSYNVKVANSSALNNFIDYVRKNGIVITEMSKQKNTLEDMFISLISESEKGEKK
jgi:ABC-2 type transport system ATP-binding protein